MPAEASAIRRTALKIPKPSDQAGLQMRTGSQQGLVENLRCRRAVARPGANVAPDRYAFRGCGIS